MTENILCFKAPLSIACFASKDVVFILQETPHIVPGTIFGGIIGWYLVLLPRVCEDAFKKVLGQRLIKAVGAIGRK
jgi:hypothetical protein